jgi:GntR family transcriptional regulator
MSNFPPPTTPGFFNPFPIYLQIRHIIERRLYAECELGDRLPTEQALREEFGVSRETIREALRGLEEEGIIRRYRAKGTFFVRLPDKPSQDRVTGMVEDCTSREGIRVEVLAAAVVKAPEELTRIGTPPDPEAWLLERLYYLHDRPLAMHEIYAPPTVGEWLSQLDLSCAAVKSLIEKRLGAACTEESRHLDAMVADARLARLLDIAVGAPVLKVTRVHRLGDMAMRALSYSYYRADRYYYTMDIAPLR